VIYLAFDRLSARTRKRFGSAGAAAEEVPT